MQMNRQPKKQFLTMSEDLTTIEWGNNFQTPENICNYMAGFLPDNAGTILEPTPGQGNLVATLESKGSVMAPKDFFSMPSGRFDYVVMNPPFTPMARGYKILFRCMEYSDHIIALMPWLTLINADRRTKKLIDFGLVSITHLPRTAFKGSRVQTCIIQLSKGFTGETKFILFQEP